MQKTEIKKRFDSVVGQFKKHDIFLLKSSANERSMTHKFAEYLQQLFPEYHVDCEYNRDGFDKKVLEAELKIKSEEISSDDEEGKTVFPDILIHKRGEKGKESNMVVIEAKKVCPLKSSDVGKSDKIKLRKFLQKFEYQYAIFIRFSVGDIADINYEFVGLNQ